MCTRVDTPGQWASTQPKILPSQQAIVIGKQTHDALCARSFTESNPLTR
jgi:hypothetical protein